MRRQYALYYHIWVPEDTLTWQLLVDEQIKRIARARIHNLCDVFCCISSRMHEAVYSFVSQHEWINVISSTSDESSFEGLTLHSLWRDARAPHSYRFVGYMHTKGIRYLSFPCNPKVFSAVNSWRHLLELSTLDNFQCHLNKLDYHDATGVGFKINPWPHFSGNMWWASARYIRKLSDPLQYKPEPVAAMNLSTIDNARLNFERWIASEKPSVFDFCQQPYFRDGRPVHAGLMDPYQEDITPFISDNLMFG